MDNENLFFRNMTIRICGNLEIEKSLYSALKYLREYIPVQSLFLQLYEHNLGAMRTIAMADKENFNKSDLLTPLPQEIKERFSQLQPKKIPALSLIQNPQDHLLSRAMLEYHQAKTSSIIIMSLFIENIDNNSFLPINKIEDNKTYELLLSGKALGSLIFLADEEYRFTEEDTHSLGLLREPFTIAMSNAIKHRTVQDLTERLTEENHLLNNRLEEKQRNIIGRKFGLRRVMSMIQKVAIQDSPVLLLGETGSGKDIIAEEIHKLSGRKDKPFVVINCGAIPDSLIDSELFGHERGAFTGAGTQKKGRFERAQGGTVFLDEIGELPLQAQVRLLRVLQNKEIERIGGQQTIHVNIRIIAATHRNLEDQVKEGQFREDLWFRLNVFPVQIPPLRERQDDIPLLVDHFIKSKARELKLPSIPLIAEGAMESLLKYHWPGNVRELENIIERSLILFDGTPLSFDNLSIKKPDTTSMLLADVEKAHLEKVLFLAKGKIHGPGGAAAILGINPSTLRNRLDKLGIKYRKKSLN